MFKIVVPAHLHVTVLVLTAPDSTIDIGAFVELARAEGFLHLFDVIANALFQARYVDVVDVLGSQEIVT